MAALGRTGNPARELLRQVHRTSIPHRWLHSKVQLLSYPHSQNCCRHPFWRPPVRCQSTAAVAGAQTRCFTSAPLRGPQATGFACQLHSQTRFHCLLRPGVRCQSTAAGAGVQVDQAAALENLLPLEKLSNQLVQEPSFAELGLESYTPVGLILKILESFHLDLGMPWWGAIVAGTVLVRCMVLPLIIKAQRDMMTLNNHLLKLNVMAASLNEAKESGDRHKLVKAFTELEQYQKIHNINPLRGFILPLIQGPIFISFFFALRKMTDLPVPSMESGGLWWFTDLTAPDPYYLLPLTVTVSMWIIMEFGMEGGVQNPNFHIIKNVLRVMPLLFLPVTIYFPTAIFTYWLTSNLFSLVQGSVLRLPAVRTFFHIPAQVAQDPKCLPTQEDFFKSLKKGWNNVKIAQQFEEKVRHSRRSLPSAHEGSEQQTFSHKPLQQNKALPTKPLPQKRQLG